MTNEEFNEFVDKCLQGIRIQSEMGVEAFEKKYDEGYQKGLDDAWEIGKALVLSLLSKRGGIPYHRIEELFGVGTVHEIFDMPVTEAKAKYDEWKAKKDEEEREIRVGDEVEDISCGFKYVITKSIRNELFEAVNIESGACRAVSISKIAKTGKRYELPWIKGETE